MKMVGPLDAFPIALVVHGPVEAQGDPVDRQIFHWWNDRLWRCRQGAGGFYGDLLDLSDFGMRRPLAIQQVSDQRVEVNGVPFDCVSEPVWYIWVGDLTRIRGERRGRITLEAAALVGDDWHGRYFRADMFGEAMDAARRIAADIKDDLERFPVVVAGHIHVVLPQVLKSRAIGNRDL